MNIQQGILVQDVRTPNDSVSWSEICKEVNSKKPVYEFHQMQQVKQGSPLMRELTFHLPYQLKVMIFCVMLRTNRKQMRIR